MNLLMEGRKAHFFIVVKMLAVYFTFDQAIADCHKDCTIWLKETTCWVFSKKGQV